MLLAALGVGIAAYLVLRPTGDDVPLSVAAAIAGHPAPDFTLGDLDGDRRQLRLQRGHAVMLNFWGIYCLPCRHEMPEIQRAVAHFAGQPITIWGIEDQSNPVSAIRQFVDQIGVSYSQLPDLRLRVGLQYKVNALPVSVFISPDGRVTLVYTGPLTYADFVANLDAAARSGGMKM